MRHPRNQARSSLRCAFTLIELLAVVAIVAVLVLLLLPAVNSAREAARRISCVNNLRQTGVGLLAYESAHGKFPPGQFRLQEDTEIWGWTVAVLPYVEEYTTFWRLDLRQSMTSRHNKGTFEAAGPTTTVIPIFLCPSTGRRHLSRVGDRIGDLDLDGDRMDIDPTLGEDEDHRPMDGMGCIDYMANSGPNRKAPNPAHPERKPYGMRNLGVFSGFKDNPGRLEPVPAITVSRIKDGTARTLAIVECTGQGWLMADATGLEHPGHGVWASGLSIGSLGKEWLEDLRRPDVLLPAAPAINHSADLAWANETPRSDHPGGINALFCDGHVTFLGDDLSAEVLRCLASRASGDGSFLPAGY